MSASKTVILPGTGDKMPTIAYGTWTVWLNKPGEVYECVKTAIANGYRHIDCAWVYDNEDEVGQAITDKIKDKTITREDIFITTKIWDNYHARDRVKVNLEKSLAKLQTTYADLVLVHWPTSFKDGDDNFPTKDGRIEYSTHDITVTWKGMEDCVNAGLARNIGLSNFNSHQIQRILDSATIKPCNLQDNSAKLYRIKSFETTVEKVEINPTFTNEKLREFAKSRNLTVSSYAPLGAPGRPWKKNTDPCAIEDSIVKAIAVKKNKSPAQVIIRWHLQQGLCVCVKSINSDRIRENIQVFDFELSTEEIAQISGLNRNHRLYTQDVSKSHPEYPFHAPF